MKSFRVSFFIVLAITYIFLFSIPTSIAEIVHSSDPEIVDGCYVDDAWGSTNYQTMCTVNEGICGTCEDVIAETKRAWTFSDTHENFCYGDGQSFTLPLDDILQRWFTRPAYDTWAVGFGVNKIRHDSEEVSSRFVFYGMSEHFGVCTPKPIVANDVYFDMRLQTVRWTSNGYSNQEIDQTCACTTRAYVGDPIMRIIVGIKASWNNTIDDTVHFLELELKRTPNSDRVTTTTNFDCGPTHSESVYTRHAYYQKADDEATELIYLDATKLHQLPNLSYSDDLNEVTTQIQDYHINLTKVLRNAGFVGPNPDWNTTYIDGVYVGVEVWGKAWVEIALDKWKVYTPYGETSTAVPFVSKVGLLAGCFLLLGFGVFRVRNAIG